MMNMDRLLEKLETLDGSRRNDLKGRAAVRREDLVALLQLPTMNAQQSTGEVSAQNFEALLGDVVAIHKALEAIAQKVKS